MERAKRSWKEDWTYEVERFCYVTTAGPVAAAVWSVDVRPVLKWANICFVNLVGLFVEPSPTQLILNWTQFCFANLVRSIRRTATNLYSGSKKLRSGNTRPVWRTLPLIGWDQEALLWVRKKEKYKGMTVQCRYFTRFGGNCPICWLVGGAALSLGSRMI